LWKAAEGLLFIEFVPVVGEHLRENIVGGAGRAVGECLRLRVKDPVLVMDL